MSLTKLTPSQNRDRAAREAMPVPWRRIRSNAAEPFSPAQRFAVAGSASAKAPSSTVSASTEAAPESARDERAWVLLVEDNRGDVFLVKEALFEHNVDAEVVVTLDGEQAIQMIQRLDANPADRCPRVVILDLNLPKKNGHEVLSHLRKSGRCADLHVIVFSSSNAAKDREAAFTEGADEYVCKPSSLQAFLEIGRTIGEALRTEARHVTGAESSEPGDA